MPTAIQRRLILIRHAKAVEDDVGGDHLRPLASRGRDDARALGSWLRTEHLLPELTLCSTATRTRETLELISDGHNLPTILRDRLYLASPGEILAQLQSTDDAVKSLALIGHNPGMHGILGLLAGDYKNERDAEKTILKFPTAACAVLEFEAAHWEEIAPQSGLLTHLRWPADH